MTDAAATVDAAARDRIVNELGSTLFVEAGAGTGKTHQLVERIFSLVAGDGDPVPLSAIAAITFTEAAAAELRVRVRERLEDAIAHPDSSAEVRERCLVALGQVDEAAIGTLHGFCLRILSEHPLHIQVPPHITVLDEVSSQLAFDQRWDDFVDELYTNPSDREAVLRAWALGITVDPGRNTMKHSLRDIARTFDESWDRIEPYANGPAPQVGPIDFAPINRALPQLLTVAAGCDDPQDKLCLRLAAVEAEARTVLDDPDELVRLELVRNSWERWGKPGQGGARKPWGGDTTVPKAALVAFSEVCKQVVADASDEVLRYLGHRLAQTTCAAAEARRSEGRLVFHDLLVLARRLLRSSEEARGELGHTYQRLLIDEFQDTDPIQIEVAALIAASVASGGEHWSEIDTTPGRLFFVGDPKQSIYRFRRADIALFLKARDRYAGDDRVVLSQNFRTVPPVLDWVNAVFTSLMPDEVPDAQPAYEALAPDREGCDGVDHRVLVLGGPDVGKAGEVRQAEAAAVAAAISSISESPQKWKVFDVKTKSWREARWSDVTILIPTRTSLRQLEDALEAAQVPYRVATGSLVFDTQEVRDALAALAAIDDPGDTIALVAALRSPLYACSDRDLFRWYEAGGRWDLARKTAPEGIGEDHPVAQAMFHLRSLWLDRWWTEPSALLARVLSDRQAFLLGHAQRRPREVWRRLRFLVDQARAFEEAAGGDLRAFLQWAERQRLEGSRVHEPLMVDTDDDAVSIVTVHAAKGLEFPIAVFSGATTDLDRKQSRPRVHWNGDIPEIKLLKDQRTGDFDRLADIETEMDEHERLRLLYVACTRARDHMIVSAFHPADTASFGRHIHLANPECHRTWSPVGDDLDPVEVLATAGGPTAVPELDISAAARDAWSAGRQELLAAQARPRVVSATTLAHEAATSADSSADDGTAGAGADVGAFDLDPDGPMETADDEAAVRRWRRGRAGTAIGRAVHATLELLGDSDDDHLVAVLATQQAHVEAVPDAVDSIIALARSAVAAPSLVAARQANRRWRELFVAAPVGDRAVEGYVDLLYEDAQGQLVLVDYKTDSARDEADVVAKVERYRLQLAAYCLAIESSTGLTVGVARLVFCRAEGAIERDIPDLEAAKTAVLTALEVLT